MRPEGQGRDQTRPRRDAAPRRPADAPFRPGIGLVAAFGVLTLGAIGVTPTAAEAQYEVPLISHDFDPADFYDDPKAIRRSDRFEQFAVAATQEALAQSGGLDMSVATTVAGAEVIQ